MATRLEEQGTLQCAHEPDQTTGRRLRYGCRIRLHHGPPRPAVGSKTANCAEEVGWRRTCIGSRCHTYGDVHASLSFTHHYETSILHNMSGLDASAGPLKRR